MPILRTGICGNLPGGWHDVRDVQHGPKTSTESVRRKVPGGWHDMRRVQYGTNNSTQEIHREGHCAGLMSTRAPWHEDLKIDSGQEVGLFGGCALVDWSFHGGTCSFPGILTHPHSSAHQLHSATVDVGTFPFLCCQFVFKSLRTLYCDGIWHVHK